MKISAGNLLVLNEEEKTIDFAKDFPGKAHLSNVILELSDALHDEINYWHAELN